MQTALKQWTVANNVTEIKEKTDREQWGAVYAVEYGDHLKIGFTKDVIKRVKNFLHQTSYNQVKIGKIAYTPYHSNYQENEKILHSLFAPFRTKGTELFDIPQNEFLDKAPELQFDEVIFDYQKDADELRKAKTIVPIDTDLVIIDNKPLKTKDYKGERVTTFKDIDFAHEKVNGTTKRLFGKYKDTFVDGIEYFLLTGKELADFKSTSNFDGDFKSLSKINREIILITEMGYMALVVYFRDEKASLIKRLMVMKYFKSKPNKKVELATVVTNLIKNQERVNMGAINNMIIETTASDIETVKAVIEDITFFCNVDSVAYKSKDEAKAKTAAIVKRMKAKDHIKQMTPERLAKAVTKGYSFTTAALSGTTESDFVSQQLLVLDIDNERTDIPIMTVEDAKARCQEIGLIYSFMYYSFSHSTRTPKFRIVCVLDKPITDPIQAKAVNQYLITLFPQADKSCFNLDRFYYGTNNGLATEVYNRTTTVPAIPESQPEPEQVAAPESDGRPSQPKAASHTAGQAGEFNLTQAIRDFDLLAYVEHETGTQGKRQGKDVLFNPCPLCGHYDHFYIDTEKNLFKCHSSRNGKGGNVINYIMERRGIDKKAAREFFIYDIMGQERKGNKAAKKQEKVERQPDGNADKIDFAALSTWEQITSKELFQKIFSNKDKTERTHNISQLRTTAKECRRAAEFDNLVKVYQDEERKAEREKFLEENPNGLYFTDCPILLNCSKYRGNDTGIYSLDVCVFPQPLVITQRTVEIENGNVRIELAARIKGKWEYITVDKEIIASKTKIVSLANSGIMVTTENAEIVVNYLQCLQVENEDAIPTVKAVSHMGYIMGKTNTFVPYTEDLIYNGDTAYSNIFKAVHTKGSLEAWVNLAKEVRGDSLAARAALATSFASPLIQRLDKLNFFLHTWGDSDTGKSVNLGFAASVWGQPDKYMRNLNSTGVAFERNAYFFHNLPFILDELQTVKNDKLSQLIYSGTQGQGRMRGTVRGIDKVLEWRLAFLTAGEQPLTGSNSGTGEINRIIDIYVKNKVFKNPSHVHEVISDNYGHAGKFFIEQLKNYDLDEMIRKWEAFVHVQNEKTSGKQRMSASLMLCADELINRMLFELEPNAAQNSTVDFFELLSEVLADSKAADQTRRAYEFIVGWVAENYVKFANDSITERWGKFVGESRVLISNNALEAAIQKAGFNYRAVLKGLAEKEYIVPSDGKEKKNTKTIRLEGQIVKGIELKLDIFDEEESPKPFTVVIKS